eukprot:9150684-Pyramimonas_sp.AAC.1
MGWWGFAMRQQLLMAGGDHWLKVGGQSSRMHLLSHNSSCDNDYNYDCDNDYNMHHHHRHHDYYNYYDNYYNNGYDYGHYYNHDYEND